MACGRHETCTRSFRPQTWCQKRPRHRHAYHADELKEGLSMATESLAPSQRLHLSDVIVVDADVHAHETAGALAPYCDMPWRRSLELLADMPERYLDVPGFAPKLNLNPPFPGGFNLRTVTSAAQMKEELCAPFPSTSASSSPTTCSRWP